MATKSQREIDQEAVADFRYRTRMLEPDKAPGILLDVDIEKKLLFGPQGQAVSGTQFIWSEGCVVKPR